MYCFGKFWENTNLLRNWNLYFFLFAKIKSIELWSLAGCCDKKKIFKNIWVFLKSYSFDVSKNAYWNTSQIARSFDCQLSILQHTRHE